MGLIESCENASKKIKNMTVNLEDYTKEYDKIKEEIIYIENEIKNNKDDESLIKELEILKKRKNEYDDMNFFDITSGLIDKKTK